MIREKWKVLLRNLKEEYKEGMGGGRGVAGDTSWTDATMLELVG